MFEYERDLAASRGFASYCGTDEAGRGPLAGPVYAAAVFLGDVRLDGINDSKKLSPRKRDVLFVRICEETQYAVCSASVEEIETLNILGASQLAMRRAVHDLTAKIRSEAVLVDGNIARGFPIPAICVVGGDAKCASIAAASILAKVSRDREMDRLDKLYPGYGFEQHKGYPTKQHYEALQRLGPSPIHRPSFLKKMLARDAADVIPENLRKGMRGEELALESLVGAGYIPMERNFRSRTGEIDLIVRNDGLIVFVEVKLRKNRAFADAAEFVDAGKIARIRKTAEFYLMKHNIQLQPRFDVVEVYLRTDGMDASEIRHIIDAF